MSNKRTQKLRQAILECNIKLLKLGCELESSKESNIKYNKILIKKAVYKKELSENSCSILTKFIKGIKCKTSKRICDYF